MTLSILMSDQYSTLDMNYSFIIQSSTPRHLYCVLILPSVNSSVMNIQVEMPILHGAFWALGLYFLSHMETQFLAFGEMSIHIYHFFQHIHISKKIFSLCMF